MLIAFGRRAPRTKSIFDRASSRCSLPADNQYEYSTMGNKNQNHLDLIDSIPRQYNNTIVSSNEHYDSNVSVDSDTDNDEYACSILFCLSFFLPSLFSLYNTSSFA
jgi:hypothetical protein